MDQYQITLRGLSPLLMHNDNLAFSERHIKAWQSLPENKQLSVAGDDRSPAWTWIGYLYHDSQFLGVNSDNIMTMLREGGAKVANKGKETFKKQTQSGIMLDQQQFDLYVGGHRIGYEDIKALIGNTDFNAHLETAELLGFELNVKRAKINKAKHVRVRPMFRDWELRGSLTVLDSELFGLTKPILETVLNQAGALCGLCDWRPSSPSSGTFGKFKPEVKKIS